MSARDKRLFARLDLDYADHPKIGDLSDSAFRAHVEMILYSRKYLTDGLIPNRIANRFGSDALSELQSNDPVAPSLSANSDGSYTLHGYADMNETRAEVERRQARNSANGKLGGRPPKTQPVSKSVSDSGSKSGAQTKAETETETETSISSSEIADAIPRPEIDHLCTLLADLIEANGSKRPNIGKGWHDAARLMIDKDGRTPAQVENAIRWCQASEFWRANVMSMPKLREKYDQLRLAALRDKKRGDEPEPEDVRDGFLFRNGKPVVGGPRGMTPEQYNEWLDRRAS